MKMKDGDKINMGRYRPIENEIFHVHTWRCKHAGEEREWEYIERAMELGAERIVFTDHCPFPGDLFRGRWICHNCQNTLLHYKN